MTRQTFLAVMVFLLGCAVAQAGNEVVSLRSGRSFPTDEMEHYFSPEAWKAIAEAPINGYVVLRGSIGPDQKVKVTMCDKSYPDRSRDALATQFANRVRIVATNVGSHIAPAAEVFVFFYDSKEEIQQAVVFGRSREGVMKRDTTNRESYLEVIDYRKKAATLPPATPDDPASGASGPAAAPAHS